MQQQRCADDFRGLHLRVASMERDIEQIKASVQAKIRGQMATPPPNTAAQNPDLPLSPAAPTDRGAGKGKAKTGAGGKNRRAPAARAGEGEEKLTPQAASAGIAAALQALTGEPEPGADAPSNDVGAVAVGVSQPQGPLVTLKRKKTITPPADTPAAGGTGESAGHGQSSADTSTDGAAESTAIGTGQLPLVGSKVRVLRSSHQKSDRFIGGEGVVCNIKGTWAEIKLPNPNPKMSVPAFVRFEINALEVL